MTLRALPRNFFFSSSEDPVENATAEMQMLRDGRHFTDADALIRTEEALEHLREVADYIDHCERISSDEREPSTD